MRGPSDRSGTFRQIRPDRSWGGFVRQRVATGKLRHALLIGVAGPRTHTHTHSMHEQAAPRRDEARSGRASQVLVSTVHIWLRGQDLNLRPLGYEPNELPGCSTPRLNFEF
jgi:uncharacterized membrane protein